MFLLGENNVFWKKKKKKRNTSFLPSMVFLKSTTQFTKNVNISSITEQNIQHFVQRHNCLKRSQRTLVILAFFLIF